MMGYYSKRIDELTSRKHELEGQYLQIKLSLNAIKKEIETCKIKMNELTNPIDISKRNNDISKLENTIKKLTNERNQLKKENTQLKHDLQAQENLLIELETEMISKSVSKEEIDDAKKYGNKNIFQNVLGKDMPHR